MNFRVVHKPSNNHARSPFRIVEQATGREIDWINHYLDLRDASAAWPTPPCALMRTICCTFSAGGRVFITPTSSPKMPSPNRRCWTMCDSSPASNAEPAGCHHQPARCHR